MQSRYQPLVVTLITAFALLSVPECRAVEAVDHEWLRKKLNYRYFIEFDTLKGLQATLKVYANTSADATNVYRSYESIVGIAKVIKLGRSERVGYFKIEFDKEGNVVSPHTAGVSLVGKLADNGRILALVPSVKTPDPRGYSYGYYFMGLRGSDEQFAPTVCHIVDDLRYEADWPKDISDGNFGCREWAYQLYDKDRPYIDVTSWYRNKAWIGTWVGWSRFEDPPKPVIGKHGKHWYCLYECPTGEKAGLIPDIKQWTARHGYPLPTRPKKQPMFPNADFRNEDGEPDDC